MAYIPKKKRNYNKKDINKTFAQKYVYNTPSWKSLRLIKLHEQALCEMCLEEDRIKGAEHVHHITPFVSGKDYNQKLWLAFDYNNLMSICIECHNKIHKRK